MKKWQIETSPAAPPFSFLKAFSSLEAGTPAKPANKQTIEKVALHGKKKKKSSSMRYSAVNIINIFFFSL